jgi:hypothetical protein
LLQFELLPLFFSPTFEQTTFFDSPDLFLMANRFCHRFALSAFEGLVPKALTMGSHDGRDSIPFDCTRPDGIPSRRPSEAFFGALQICLMRVVIPLAGGPVSYRFPVLPEPHLGRWKEWAHLNQRFCFGL